MSRVLTVLVCAFVVLLVGEVLIVGFKAIGRNDKRIEARNNEITQLALSEIKEIGAETELTFLGVINGSDSLEMSEVYDLTVNGVKYRVVAKINKDGTINSVSVEGEVND